jgi:hypothetical protein
MVFCVGSGCEPALHGSCLVCREGTDSGLAFAGSLEWVIVQLVKLGLMGEVASALVDREAAGCDRVTLPIRVCVSCAGQRRVSPVALGIPVYCEG